MTSFMQNLIKYYRNYKSVTCKDADGNNLEYDLCSRTVVPVGLLRDIAVSESELSQTESEYAWNVFSVYCMYKAAKKIGSRESEDIVDSDFVYEAAACAKMCMEKGNYNGFNSLFNNLLYWRQKDSVRKNFTRKKGVKNSEDGSAKTEWEAKTVPLEVADIEGGELSLRDEVNQLLLDKSLRLAEQKENIELVQETLKVCVRKKVLSQKQIDILCHKFGIGENYELLSQTKIAEKFGVSDANVSRTIADAYVVLKQILEDNSMAA
ncbi:MAG: hypothetical protein IJS14_11080 [Lentisphaeria bacterium]|nr:hypothetical protein [Lentisphaeria bacterium]